jgi:hypothetical protein
MKDKFFDKHMVLGQNSCQCYEQSPAAELRLDTGVTLGSTVLESHELGVTVLRGVGPTVL